MKILSDAADFMSGGTPNKANPAFWGGDISWYSASNMTDRFIGNDSPKITYEGLIAGSKMAPKGSTLILVRGSGLFNYIPICYVEKAVAFNQDVKAICPKDDTDPVFLHFWMESLRNTLNKNLGVTGIGAGKLDTDFLKNLPFPDLPRKKQEYIAQYAQSFDRKIDLNRRTNETLEAMARALFRDWFVDFGPTRAKMAGEAPYLAPELWELFPDGMDDEGKPEGWQITTLGNLATNCGESIYPEQVDPLTPYVGLEHLPRRSISLSTWDRAEKITSGKSVFHEGNILFGKLRPYFHKVVIAPVNGICSTDIVVIDAKKDIWRSIVRLVCSSKDFVDFTDRTSQGTKMPRTSWGTMKAYELIQVPDNICFAFENITNTFFVKIQKNIMQSRNLAQLRDLLLPKLMSGEISIRDAEKMVEDAA